MVSGLSESRKEIGKTYVNIRKINIFYYDSRNCVEEIILIRRLLQ